MPEDENGETMPRRLYCLTMPPAEEAGRPVSDLTGLKLPPEVLRDNIADAQEHPSYGNWAGGIVKQYSRLGMASPFSSSG